jgi:hypothetical protein
MSGAAEGDRRGWRSTVARLSEGEHHQRASHATSQHTSSMGGAGASCRSIGLDTSGMSVRQAAFCLKRQTISPARRLGAS